MASPSHSASVSRSVSSGSLPSRHASPAIHLSPAEQEKEALVRAAIDAGDVDTLVHLAMSASGLVSDSLRCTAWPLLLGCSARDSRKEPWTDLPEHKDEHQVGLDVNRAFVHYPKKGMQDSEKQLDRRKQELSNVIIHVLRQHPALCYFQGYHDIVQVFLLVLGPEDAPTAVARLSLLRIRDFMLSSLEPALAQLELLRPILRAADPSLYHHLRGSQPTFALAGTMTMFAHNIEDYKDITRLFDFFLAGHAAMPIYFFAAVVLSKREKLLAEDDEDMLYVTLGRLPAHFDVEFLIARTVELYERLPPASLDGYEWWWISSSSVLKSSATTTRLRQLTLEDGERYFAKQERDLQREQSRKRALKKMQYMRLRLWYYRRYGAVALAVAVGAYALWLGKNGDISKRYPMFNSLGHFVWRYLGGSA
ncbi:GTPase-activating protein [Pyrenophora tritici-repentis]|uniref:GTPase-activating protein n=1 Tax=Pyrenophora tritici-repentis TaxID=45151 RepID=A0A2W1D0B5_9PLEO|nr:GTPase-activating protein [Pyrenophora tritici-repentis]KAF7569627.1 GTPase-activating protein [Pyrenophora tritici-repentis]KAI0572770.1 GTPase-activating protein [Pyrenophora tritici-repentis]KAI0573479.1 GTPase-activating protein [Pyrenophora tritici-repentis]KAI0605452.1 GTPase-activating protein [Pyrenophora tritici-repentis]